MKELLLLLTVASLAVGCRTHHHHRKADCHKARTTPLECHDDGRVAVPQPQRFDSLPQRPPQEVRDQFTNTVATGVEQKMELKAEDMTVDKRTVSNGAIRIRKYVVSEQKSVPIEVCREDYVVERVPASGQPTTAWGEGETYIELPLTRQVATPVITPRIYETLRIRKVVDCDTEQVTGTVRTERFEVIRQ